MAIPLTNTPLASKTATQLNAIIPTYFEGIKYIEDFTLQSVGVNLFDGKLELGNLSTTDGSDVADTARIRSINYSNILPLLWRTRHHLAVHLVLPRQARRQHP